MKFCSIFATLLLTAYAFTFTTSLTERAVILPASQKTTTLATVSLPKQDMTGYRYINVAFTAEFCRRIDPSTGLWVDLPVCPIQPTMLSLKGATVRVEGHNILNGGAGRLIFDASLLSSYNVLVNAELTAETVSSAVHVGFRASVSAQEKLIDLNQTHFMNTNETLWQFVYVANDSWIPGRGPTDLFAYTNPNFDSPLLLNLVRPEQHFIEQNGYYNVRDQEDHDILTAMLVAGCSDVVTTLVNDPLYPVSEDTAEGVLTSILAGGMNNANSSDRGAVVHKQLLVLSPEKRPEWASRLLVWAAQNLCAYTIAAARQWAEVTPELMFEIPYSKLDEAEKVGMPFCDVFDMLTLGKDAATFARVTSDKDVPVISYAAVHGYGQKSTINVIHCLISAGAGPDVFEAFQALLKAATTTAGQTLLQLAKGAEPELVLASASHQINGVSVLELVDKSLFTYFMEIGLDPNIKNEDGSSPIWNRIYAKTETWLVSLIYKALDQLVPDAIQLMNTVDENGETLLHHVTDSDDFMYLISSIFIDPCIKNTAGVRAGSHDEGLTKIVDKFCTLCTAPGQYAILHESGVPMCTFTEKGFRVVRSDTGAGYAAAPCPKGTYQPTSGQETCTQCAVDQTCAGGAADPVWNYVSDSWSVGTKSGRIKIVLVVLGSVLTAAILGFAIRLWFMRRKTRMGRSTQQARRQTVRN